MDILHWWNLNDQYQRSQVLELFLILLVAFKSICAFLFTSNASDLGLLDAEWREWGSISLAWLSLKNVFSLASSSPKVATEFVSWIAFETKNQWQFIFKTNIHRLFDTKNLPSFSDTSMGLLRRLKLYQVTISKPFAIISSFFKKSLHHIWVDSTQVSSFSCFQNKIPINIVLFSANLR